MRVAALTLAGIKLKSIDQYQADLDYLLKASGNDLVVLPAYSSLLLGLETGAITYYNDFDSTLRGYLAQNEDWHNLFLNLHSSLAAEFGIYLVCGTTVEKPIGKNDGKLADFFYQTAYCFNPDGELCCRQRQTHLTHDERELGFSRGEELNIFTAGDLQVGLVVGNDARHPEVGRIFALRGADLLLHSGAFKSGLNCWPQAAGMWAQVQQNQCWAVEAQLSANIAGRKFGASPAVIGPCEITPGQSGYIARGYPESPIVTAELDNQARQSIKKKYPLLRMLIPHVYSALQGSRNR